MTYEEALTYLTRSDSDYTTETMDAISAIVDENNRVSSAYEDEKVRYIELEDKYKTRWIEATKIEPESQKEEATSETLSFSDLYEEYKEEK